MQTLRDTFTRLTRAQRGWLGGGIAAVFLVFLVVVIISGGDDPPVDTTTTSGPSTTTTVPSTTSTTLSTTTTDAGHTAARAWPLTGLPTDEDPSAVPLLAVKLDNSISSRPQQGLEMADLVFDIPVEGGISRLLAFYQSRLPSEIGPVRSVREVDPKLLAPFDVYLAYSGGVSSVVFSVREVATDLGDPALGSIAYSRAPDRPAPYDLMFDPVAGLATIGEVSGARDPGLSFGVGTEGEQALTVEISSSARHEVRYGYSAADGGYLRFHQSQPHRAASGDQIGAANVVVLVVDQLETGRTDSSGAPVPDFEVLGTGPAVVFRDGTAIVGRWERGRLGDFFRFFTEEGSEILLAPGTTWIHLVPEGRTYEWR